MKSGTVLALVVSFALGIGCTVSVIAWFVVAAANAGLVIQVADLETALNESNRNNQALSSDLSRAQSEIATFQAEIRNVEGLRKSDARAAKIAADELRSQIRSINAQLSSAYKAKQQAVDDAIAIERRSLARKSEQISQLEDDLEALRVELRTMLATEGVRDAMDSARARDARADRLEAEKDRLISFRIYDRTVTTTSPAGKKYVETEELVVFDTNRDGRFSTGDEIWMQGRKAYDFESTRLGGFTLKREGKCLPEGMKDIAD